ncbi:MAG TPA: hypothetical protein VLJ10_03165, partial [Candidatus Bathyarchaeia archaeon]|nr:hypothetical protein [Candidatus Bathyarchaeia archaeon]
LRRAARKCQNDMESAQQMVREENQQKREYIKQLKKTMQDMETARAGVVDRFSIDEKEMRRYLTLLEEENELLFAHRQMLEDQDLLQQSKDDQEHTILVLSDQYEQKQEERDRLQKEKINSQNAIVTQREKNNSLKRDQDRIRKANDKLAQDVETVKRKVETVRKDAFGQKRDELLKAIKEQGERNLVLNQEMIVAKSANEAGQKQLKDGRQIAAQLLEEIRILNESVPALKEQEKELATQKENLSNLAETKLAALKDQIKQGQMRKKALDASLDVINKKYQRGREQHGDFEAERAELMRYLDVLRTENEALQKKLKILQGASS